MPRILFGIIKFQTLRARNYTHYTLQGTGAVLGKNVRPSDVTISDILDSNPLPIFLHALNYVKAWNTLNEFETFTDWEQFQSLASELISPKIYIDSGE
jgi:hypothetical protein